MIWGWGVGLPPAEDELEKVINLYGGCRYATAILCDYHEAENVVQGFSFP